MEKILYAFLLFMWPVLCFSQKAGKPFIRNYSQQEYKASSQNWAIVQDKRGILYVGNTSGLLEFDGVSWRLLELPVVRSLAIDKTDRIYAGLSNNFGYLEPDKNGNNVFHSIKELIPGNKDDISSVNFTHVLSDRVIFQTELKIYIYKDDKIHVINTGDRYRRSFLVKGQVYIWIDGKGLMRLVNDHLEIVADCEIPANDRITCILPYENDDMLLLTRNHGAYIYSPATAAKPYKPSCFKEIDHILTQNQFYGWTRLQNGDYAIGSITSGVTVFDARGVIKEIYDKSAGMMDNSVLTIFEDRNQQLWTGLDNGISRIEKQLPFRYFNDQNGLYGSPLCIIFFQNRLYVATTQYLHVQSENGNFERIPGTSSQNFCITEANGIFLLASNPGIFEVKGTRILPLANTSTINALTFYHIKNNPDILMVGAGNGLYLLEYKNSAWKLKHQVRGFNLGVYDIVKDDAGNVWVTTMTNLYRLRLNASMDSVILSHQCTPEDGLPSEFGWPFQIRAGRIVFSTDNGIYRFSVEKGKFEPDPDFPMIKGRVAPFMPDQNKDIWFEEAVGNSNFERGVLRFRNDRYLPYRTPFYKLAGMGSGESQNSICVGPDSSVYFGVPMALIQYKPDKTSDTGKPFQTLIRKVYLKDSVLFGGTPAGIIDTDQTVDQRISYSFRDVTFHYAAITFEDAEKNLYSYRLLGSDTTWSSWVSDHKKEYTNLPIGKYTFQVRSKNQYQTIGSRASYSFAIIAPWYRSWWAYCAYVFIFILAIYGLIRFRTRNLQERSRVLEKTVEQRTAQIQKLNRIGREITASLSLENIIHTIYENVNTLMDASVFTIGLYKPEQNCLEFPATIEKGVHLESFIIPMSEENRLAVWCYKNRQEVIINDYVRDYGKFVKQLSQPIAGETPESILYLPLWNKDKVTGVISAQSFNRDAYSDYHVNMLRNLATYSAIALENADAYRRLAILLDELRAAQDRLVTQSKLAALGELTAGIAHEIQNPLNFVNNFSEISNELIDELKSELSKGNQEETDSLIQSIKQNLEKINYHGKRADSIVKGMLLHSRGVSGQKQMTYINNLCDEFFRLAFHGLRAKDKSFNATMKTNFDESLEMANVVSQDIGQVVLNLIGNAFYAVTERKKLNQPGYEPTVWVSTAPLGPPTGGIKGIVIIVKDNGIGIPQRILDKIFQPFFTTKPTGEGTGLGLSLAYEIVTKGHGGELKVETKEGEGSTFIVQIPI